MKNIQQEIKQEGFRIVDQDLNRPWGGFLVIDESQAPLFAKTFFPGMEEEALDSVGKLSPKILIVEPGKRLSWQYHRRRAEIWRVIEGPVGVIASPDDRQGDVQELEAGEVIRLKQGERHRLVGLDDRAVLAEIWQHTDPDHPSDEEDIVRVQDDFGRAKE